MMMDMPKTSSKPKLGQHFLMHPRIAERIVLVAGITHADTVLEVGPGKGLLTRALLAKAKKVIAVEADATLVAGLHESFTDDVRAGRLELIHADIRDFLTYPLFSAIAENRGYHVVANIPYYITGEILRLFLEGVYQPQSMTLLVQKEVAERIARDRKETLLSLSIKAYGEPHYEFTVPRGAFVPAPAVDSAVLSVRHISRHRFSTPEEEGRFFSLLHAGFAHKRKQLAKNLTEAGFSPALVEGKVRAEDLSLDVWLALSRAGR